MKFEELSKQRYSCRSFSSKEVEQEKIDKIVQAGLDAPTAVNKQPYHIWVIQSKENLEKVRENTRFHFDAPVIFAVGAKDNEAWIRKYDDKNFAEVDASIVATHMMLEIQDLGLGTTWVGHFDAPALKKAFPEMEDFEMIALFPTGYPSEDAKPSERHYERVSKVSVL